MNTVLWKHKMFGFLVVGLIAAGCNGIPRNRSISLTATEDICKKSVEVHLVGVNRSEKEQWEKVSMTEYWQPKNPLRDSAKEYTHVFHFGQEPCEKKLSIKDPIQTVWKKKRKAGYLFILADLPGIFPDMDGNADSRRLQIPAPNSKCWELLQTEIKLEIDSSKIVSLTVPKPECE
ncbi:MAG: hypothetical protein OEW48_05665 [Phycisphaerae bacterium]|nr:hypothetical protein [Phycisphaerae bacterium]